MEEEKEREEDRKEDDVLKQHYPNLFYQIPNEVREHSGRSKEYSKIMDLDLRSGHSFDDYPIISNSQILKKISQEFLKGKKDEDLEKKMKEVTVFSRKFFEKLSKEKDIKPLEKALIAKLVWERVYENISNKKDILDLDIETVEWWHEEYEDFFPKK